MIIKIDRLKLEKYQHETHYQIHKDVLSTVYKRTPERKAAKRVMDILKQHYGNIARRKYDAETAAIDDLLCARDDKEVIKDLQALKVTDWVDHLQLDNEAFENLTHQRYEQKAAMTTAQMKDARVEPDLRYRNMVTHLEYIQMAGRSSTELIALIAELNAIVKHYKDVLTHSKSTKHTEPNGEEGKDEKLSVARHPLADYQNIP